MEANSPADAFSMPGDVSDLFLPGRVQLTWSGWWSQSWSFQVEERWARDISRPRGLRRNIRRKRSLSSPSLNQKNHPQQPPLPLPPAACPTLMIFLGTTCSWLMKVTIIESRSRASLSLTINLLIILYWDFNHSFLSFLYWILYYSSEVYYILYHPTYVHCSGSLRPLMEKATVTLLITFINCEEIKNTF